MEKTAIRIPGKETRSQTKSAIAARKILRRPRGRPLKLKQEVKADIVPPSKVKVLKKRSLKNIKSRRKMSSLEKLPTELLERVFLYCLNLDLPRASPVIAGKLSSEMVYLRTIVAGFGQTWDQCYRGFMPGSVYNNMESRRERKELQSSILRCRWATLPMILKGQDFWDQQHTSTRLEVPTLFRHFFRNPKRPEEAQDSDIIEKKSAALSLEEDFAEFSSDVASPDYSIYCSLWCSYPGLAEDVELPHSLLRGPWTEDSIKYLFWLSLAQGKINWTTSTSGEVAHMGLETAITTGNMRVICLLLRTGLGEKLDVDLLIWALQNASNNRYAVIKFLIELRNVEGIGQMSDKDKFTLAMYQEQDKAKQRGDMLTLGFLKSVEESEVFQEWK